MKTWLIAAALICGTITGTAMAGETRSAEPGHVPPSASIESLAWLAGYWEGTSPDGNPAFDTISPPTGGTIVGHFVQLDSEGAIWFSEIAYILPVNGSLEYRIKHFGPDLTGWEAKEEFVSFPLVAIEDGAAYFDRLTMRRDGDDGLVLLVEPEIEPGVRQLFTYRLKRADPTGR